MLLAIDVGNTNAVFALYDGKEVIGQWRCRTERGRTADEYFVWLEQHFRYAGIEGKVDAAILSSTAPRVVFNLRTLAKRYFDTELLIVGKPDCELGIPVRVDPHTNVGPDRLVNSVGAHKSYGGNLIVVDFGTATTFDVVGHDGAYEGGVIAPGVNLSLTALHEAAAALPNIDVARPEKVVGTNTLACMQSGIYWGYVGLIEGICQRISAERNTPMQVIGTGGLAPLFAEGSDVFHHFNRNLTIDGLVEIARLNKLLK